MLGHALAYDLALTGRMMDGGECIRHGLLSRVVAREGVLDEALRLAGGLAAKPPLAVALTKRRLARLTDAGFEETFVLWTENLQATLAARRPTPS